MSEFSAYGEAMQDVQSEPEFQSGQEPEEGDVEPRILTLSSNDFSALEDRILRTVEVVRRERQARAAAEDRAARVELQLREQLPQIEQLEKELSALRAERDQVRQRVERLLGQLDALEL